MPPTRVKRNPDAGVETAVNSVLQHQTFKRMLLFGMRSLSDFCNPSNQLYQENSLCAMDRGVLDAMQKAVVTFSDDDDLMQCSARIIWAMSEAVLVEMDVSKIQLLSQKGVPVCVSIVNSTPSDGTTVENAMDFLENMKKANSQIDATDMAPGLLAMFTKNPDTRTAARIASALAIVSENPTGATALYNGGGTSAALTYCINKCNMSDSSVQTVEGVFEFCKNMATNGCADHETLQYCIQVMDKYRSKKGAFNRGSAALAVMVGPDQLHKCLNSLKVSTPGSPEHETALVTLASMSYITSYTDEIVRAGGIPMLCELINSGLSQIESNPEKIYKMIGGAAKMLGRIASNPTNVDQLVNCNAVATLCTAVSYCTEVPETLGALCMALVPLAARESLAHEIVQYQTFATVLPILYQQVEIAEFASQAMELVATGSQHRELQEHMITNLAVEITAMCCSYHTKDSQFQFNAVQALLRLSDHLESLKSMHEYGGFAGINSNIQANISNESLVQSAVQLYEKLSRVPDARTYMADANCVDSVLNAMLEHESNESLISSGVACLTIIATEADCQKHMRDVDVAIQTAKTNPDRAYEVLAAVAGLSRVSHLRQIFDRTDAAERILQGIQRWIEGSRFEGQGRVIRAGLKTVKTIKVAGDSPLAQFFCSLCDTACLAQVKRIVELESPEDNILVHSAKAARDVAATGRFNGAENLEACLEALLKVMRKYTDSRRTLVICLETLQYLVTVESGEGAKILSKIGGINAVVQYLNKTPMYLDAQIEGFAVLATCTKLDPGAGEVLKKCNCLNALKVAMRTHSKSKELKRTIAPLLALLMPTDALEQEIQQKINECNDAVSKNKFAELHEKLVELNELLVSAEGAKIAARLNIGEAISQYASYALNNLAAANQVTEYDFTGIDLQVAMISEVSHVAEQVASCRLGAVHLIKTQTVIPSLIQLYEYLVKLDVKGGMSSSLGLHAEEASIHCLDALRLLLKTDKKCADIAFEKHFVATLCHGISNYTDSPQVLAATCGCLAGMATTPSRVSALVAQPDFANLLASLVHVIESDPKKVNKMVAMRAFQELLETSVDPTLARKIGDAGAVTALFSVIENNQDDVELITEAAKTLSLLGVRDRQILTGAYATADDYDVRQPCMILTAALNQHKNNEKASLQLFNVLNSITDGQHDRQLLKELGVMEQVSAVMRIHHNSEEIIRIGGEIFAKIGADEQVKSLMMQIISAVEASDANTIQNVDGLCARLAVFLAAPLDDPANALVHTEKCIASLVACLQAAPSNARLHSNVALVCRRLCDRCFTDENDSYGAWAIASGGMLHQIQQTIIANDNRLLETNRGVLIHNFRVLAACAANPYTAPTIHETIAPSIMMQTYQLLESSKNDPESVARILEFLRYVAEDPTVGAVLVSTQCHSASSDKADIVALTQTLMVQHQKNDAVVTMGMYLLGALAYNTIAGGHEPHPQFVNGSILKDCEAVCVSNPSKDREVAYIQLVERMILAQNYAGALGKEKTLQKLVMRVTEESEKKRLTEIERMGLVQAALRMLAAAGAAGMINDVEQAKGFEMILHAIDDYPDNPYIIADCCRALSALSANDASMATRTIKEAIPKLCSPEVAQTIANDVECSDAYADLLLQLCATEGNGRQLLTIDGLEASLEAMDSLAGASVPEIKKKSAMIRQAMSDDQPHEKTCQEVYEMLQARVTQEQSVDISAVPILQDELDFVISKMTLYSKEKLNGADPMGLDHQYGNMALEIFASVPANYKKLQQVEFVKMELSLIKSFRDEDIVLYCAKALACGCKHPPCAQEAARTQGCAQIVAESLSRTNKHSGFESNEIKEEHMCAILLLVERTAVNRNLYNKTSAITDLIKAWNDFDKGLYTTTLLRHVFRAMRRIVSDAHVDELLKANVLQRLIAIILDVNADLALLPDVLFLLGSLAVVPEIKTKIGELQGVHACYELLQRALQNPAATAVVTNTCLAFANICIGHKKNTELFHKMGGPDLNVQVLNQRGHEYDVCNAASVLLCNLLYKNEAMKKYLGQNGAPAALVKGLSNYDGSVDRSAIRCLESLFKAISNLSLYTPNIQPFLDSGIEQAYCSWLSNLTLEFPDAQVETGCRTLANLVLENDPNNMRKFGVCLVPCMNVARQGRQDTKTLILLLDIQACLCRLSDNAKAFADNEGIETTIRLIHQFDYDVGLLTLGIHLLGIQSSVASSIQKMVDADVFSILVGCVEVDAEGNEVTDLVVGGLRCTRRIINSEELAFEYCNAGGIATLANVICKSINQPMVMLEACRVLLCLLSFTTRSQKERQDAVILLHQQAQAALEASGGGITDEDGNELEAEPDPEQLANAAYGGWYHMGMDEVMIGAIVQAVVACAGAEAHTKQLRLQRVCLGVSAYFLSEQLGIDSFVGSGGDLCLIQALTNFPGELTLTPLSFIILNSIAMTSGDMYDQICTKEFVSACKTSASKVPNKKPEEKALRDVCQKTIDALASSMEPVDAFANTLTELDFSFTEWNVDPYPNGVHDLPANVKETLRKGGKLKVYFGEKDAEEIRWRSSQDLNALEWSAGADSDWNNRVPIVRIRNVAKGITSPALQRANKKEPRKVTAKLCMCIFGPANEDYPQGLELSLRAKTQKERDQFVELMVQWRDSATYNF